MTQYTRPHHAGSCDAQYSTCLRSGCPSGSAGWSNSFTRSIPIFCITLCEGLFCRAVNDHTLSSDSSSRANRRHSAAISGAYPRPQNSGSKRHPTSIPGAKSTAKSKPCNPTKPTNRPLPRSSTAHKPYPHRSISSFILARNASEALRSSVDGK